MRWYYYKDKLCKGPFEESVIQRLVDEGEIGADTPMRTDAMKDWLPLKEAVNHFGQSPATPAPAAAAFPDDRDDGSPVSGYASYLFAGMSGLAMALLAGWLWARVSVAMDVQVGYFAIGVGLAVGLAVRLLGDPYNITYGFMAGAIALFSILVGNALIILSMVSAEMEISTMEVFRMSGFGGMVKMLGVFTGPMDTVFYLIAIGAAFKVAMTKSWLKRDGG